jgi:hypothetical protein
MEEYEALHLRKQDDPQPKVNFSKLKNFKHSIEYLKQNKGKYNLTNKQEKRNLCALSTSWQRCWNMQIVKRLKNGNR